MFAALKPPLITSVVRTGRRNTEGYGIGPQLSGSVAAVVIEGGVLPPWTVSVAAVLVTAPTLLRTVAAYEAASVDCTLFSVRPKSVAPEMLTPFFSH